MDVSTHRTAISVLFIILVFFSASEAASARCLAQNQWAYANCSTGYTSRSYNYSGYGAAAAYGLQFFGSVIQQQQQHQEQQEAEERAAYNRQIAARNAYCNANYQRAANLNDQANSLWNSNWDPAAAIPLYEQAIAYLRHCGDSRNIGIIQQNLGKARKEYAAIAPDNRVEEAIQKYSDQNIYTKPNPFSKQNITGAASPNQNNDTKSKVPFDCSKPPIDAWVGWHYVCNNLKARPQLERVAYRHPIDPQLLYWWAAELCKAAPMNDKRTCITRAKVTILIAEDQRIAATCVRWSDEERRTRCVHGMYLYGKEDSQDYAKELWNYYDQQNRADAAIRRKMNELIAQRDKFPQNDPRWQALDNEITRYNDALLGVTNEVPQDALNIISTTAQPRLTDLQSRFDRVARASVDVAIEANKTDLTESERKECALVAYKTVRQAMTGHGGANVPPKCRNVVYDAVAQLAYQAAAEVDNRTPPEENLLERYLIQRNASLTRNDGNLGKLDSITPDEKMLKEGEALLKKNR
jgi:hypothetical protein